ncbi:MAG: PEP-CTERM sorting domain-containing protein [Kiritimatiellae bacterium]|jgi:hypothetical protein|nr:PEP-CTERM sorting domain-containing protein [Kiritimatiellia bacterium]
MKKVLCFTFLFVMLVAVSAKAVVIHWAVTSMPASTTSAQLVYVSENPSVGNEDVGSLVSGAAITPIGIGEQNAVDSSRGSGSYYVMLFYNDGAQDYYAYGLTALAWNDTDSITSDIYSPATLVYDASLGGVSNWIPVPEPGSAAMLALGVALLAMRRKKRA